MTGLGLNATNKRSSEVNDGPERAHHLMATLAGDVAEKGLMPILISDLVQMALGE